MKKNILVVLAFLMVLGGCFYGAFLYYPRKSIASASFDPRNATYTIANEQVRLVGGKASGVEMVGEVTHGDITDDGVDDAVFFLKQTSEGTGAFYYVVAALNTGNMGAGTNAVFLGDRIVPKQISIDTGTVVATYVERAEGEPMASTPSVARSISLAVQNTTLQEVTMRQAPSTKQLTWPDNTKEEVSDIIVNTPVRNATVNNPLLISGKARGFWFFEASFPVFLVNMNGNILGEGVAQAQGDWMTSDFVSFETTMTFTTDPEVTGEEGMLVLQKNNPSGLHENDAVLRIPVIIGR